MDTHDGDERVYGEDVGRINLTLPEDLHAELERRAEAAGMRPTSYARVLLARSIGRAAALDELHELRERIAALEERLPSE